MNFNTTMIWNNGTSAHTHEFREFELSDDPDVDIRTEDRTISIEDTMDVGTNGVMVWQDVPTHIDIENGKLIKVAVDDEATDGHFSDQAIYGSLAVLTICSNSPGSAMQGISSMLNNLKCAKYNPLNTPFCLDVLYNNLF